MSTFERVVKVLNSLGFEGEIRLGTNFANDLDADSLNHTEILMGVEEEFDREPISNDDADKLITVAAVVAYIEGK